MSSSPVTLNLLDSQTTRVAGVVEKFLVRSLTLSTLRRRVPDLLAKLRLRTAALRVLYRQERNSLVSLICTNVVAGSQTSCLSIVTVLLRISNVRFA